MKIKFWGTRGSIPTPEPGMIKYGGDTSCVEVRCGSMVIVFDCGTGGRRLGAHLAKDPQFSGKAHLFLSHTHWDHIQGFPFFGPVFTPGTEITIHGPFRADYRLEQAMEGQMSNLYFPVKMGALPSKLTFVEMIEESISIGPIKITARAMNHPQGCFAYRLQEGRHSIVYATDTEPYEDRPNEKLIELAQGADVLVHDAQFTPEEYVRDRKGWGHSTWKDAVRTAMDAQAKTLVLFHHDPYKDDEAIDAILAEARGFFPATVAASRDMQMSLEGEGDAFGVAAFTPVAVAPPRPGPPMAPISFIEKQAAIVFYAPEDLSVFNSQQFTQGICQTVADSHTRIVINFARLAHIDSAGVGSLAAIYSFARKRGIPLVLASVARPIQHVLEITRFTKLIPICKSEDEALAVSPVTT